MTHKSLKKIYYRIPTSFPSKTEQKWAYFFIQQELSILECTATKEEKEGIQKTIQTIRRKHQNSISEIYSQTQSNLEKINSQLQEDLHTNKDIIDSLRRNSNLTLQKTLQTNLKKIIQNAQNSSFNNLQPHLQENLSLQNFIKFSESFKYNHIFTPDTPLEIITTYIVISKKILILNKVIR